jgi:rubredoxin
VCYFNRIDSVKLTNQPGKTNEGFIMKTWMCTICGWIYDEARGWPDDGIAPGTRWEDVPPNWACPECGARKEDFEMVEL